MGKDEEEKTNFLDASIYHTSIMMSVAGMPM